MTQPSGSLRFAGHDLALERVPCDFCGGAEMVPFQAHMRHGVDLDSVFCARCGLCQTNPRPTREANALFYQQLYMKFHDNTTGDGSDYVAHSAKLAAPRVAELIGVVGTDKPLKVLEIGTGVGGFQAGARARTRWDVRGIEPGREQFEHCKKRGFAVENKFIEELPADAGPFDVVVSFHVFEHALSPADFIRRVNRLLPVGGLLYLEVPNLAWPGGPFANFLQLPHLYNFTAHTLRNYLTVLGGLRPVWVSEGRSNLGMMARKVGPAAEGVATDWERLDLPRFQQKMKVLDRVFKLAALVPSVPVLSKVRATLFDV